MRDTVEFGRVLYSEDDPLGMDYYTELTLAQGSRTWGHKFSEETPWFLRFGIRVSLGWAWASSIVPGYTDVSNPVMGGFMQLIFGHEKWGQLYTEDGITEGFLLRSPSSLTSRSATSRLALVRAGYFKKFKAGWTINLFTEKRSFNIDVPGAPNQYTKSRRIGGEIGYQF